jgi:hypothetical protein
MAIVRLDKITGNHLSNGRHATEDMLNGFFVQLGSLVVGERELYNITAPTDVLADEVLLHASPEVMYDPRQNALEDFFVEAGQECRLYHLTVGDIVTLSADLFTGTPVVGTPVSAQIGAFNLITPAVVGARFTAEVIEATTLGFNRVPAYAIRVLSV